MPEAVQIVHRARVIVVARVGLDGQHDGVAAHESRDVVDVPVRIVPDAALSEPDRVMDAEPFGEQAFVVVSCEAGVAHLHVRQQPLFGHQQQSVAVDLDASTLEDQAGVPVRAEAALRGEAT